MLAWMTYVIVVSALLSLAAFAAERAARVRGAQHRWIWIATLLASLFIPAAIASISIELPTLSSTGSGAGPTPLRVMTSEYLSPTAWVGAVAPALSDSPSSDALLERAWLIMSVMVTLGLLMSAAHLYLHKRSWSKASLSGREVYVAKDVGPAVVGFLRPSIVIPHWLLNRAAAMQAMVLAHEEAHLRARDQQVLAVALCLIVLMPWNLPLWWQLRRLRYAIEVDCDARVLQSGHTLADYGEALIEVGQHRSGFVGAVAGMSESPSFLERRIALMTSNRSRFWKMASIGLGCAALACVAVAAQVSPPNSADSAQPAASANTQERRTIQVAPELLSRYAGEYELAEGMIVAVRAQDGQLFARLTGQPEFPIFAESEKRFFWKVVDAQVTFIAESDQPANALILHQYGQDMRAPRVEDGASARAQAALDARIQTQTATPGSDRALTHLLESARNGSPDYEAMSPMLAKVVREQMSMMQPHLQKLGPVQSVEFEGVGNAGWDSYRVQHANGTSQWRIAMNPDGKVGGVLMVQLP